MKKNFRRQRNRDRYYHSRESKEAMKKTLAFRLLILGINFRIIGWYIAAVIFRKRGLRRVKELEREEVELEANPFRAFG